MSTKIVFSEQPSYIELRKKNVSVMFRTTALSLILNELTGIIAVLIDGIVTSQGVGIDAYSGISLLNPFTSLVLLVAGFLSTGCNLVSSRLIGVGKKEEANEAFNLASLLSAICAAILILLCVLTPDVMLRLCGINLSRYPELNQHIYGYLHGYLIGLPALMLIQVFGPILVMDGGKRLFVLSSTLLCVTDIIGDLLNAYVFHGGAFGMGVATSVAYSVQLLVLITYFTKSTSYFHLTPRACKPSSFMEIVRNGSPAMVKKVASALRDVFINYINIMIALSTVAIAAKGIQYDMFSFLYCIPTGVGRTLITMAGIYYSANDVQGLKQVFSFSVRFSTLLTGIVSVVSFIFAPFLAGLYTSDPEVLSLATFSIRWISVSLVIDTYIVLLMHFLQGTDNLKTAGALSIAERFVVPVLCALVMGLIWGSKGVLASVGVNRFIMIILIFAANCAHNHGIPTDWTHLMFLKKGFGGAQTDNMYAEIQSVEDAVQTSEQTLRFCQEHQIDERKAYLTSLCVEEMAVNVIEHAERKGIKDVNIDFHVFINDDSISLSFMDLSDQFDPTVFYKQHLDDAPEKHIGIRMVTRMAKDVRYYSTFKSNNLLINV